MTTQDMVLGWQGITITRLTNPIHIVIGSFMTIMPSLHVRHTAMNAALDKVSAANKTYDTKKIQ